MQITNVRVRKFTIPEGSQSRMLGFADITIDDCFVVHGIRIIRGDNDIFISMPNRVAKNGKRYDTSHPINAETRKMVQDAIVQAYNEI